DDVQRHSRRERARLERLSLPAWTEEFHAEFCETMQWPRARLTVGGAGSDVEVRVDPDQLRQILWNLCDNALKHAAQDQPDRAGGRSDERGGAEPSRYVRSAGGAGRGR